MKFSFKKFTFSGNKLPKPKKVSGTGEFKTTPKGGSKVTGSTGSKPLKSSGGGKSVGGKVGKANSIKGNKLSPPKKLSAPKKMKTPKPAKPKKVKM